MTTEKFLKVHGAFWCGFDANGHLMTTDDRSLAYRFNREDFKFYMSRIGLERSSLIDSGIRCGMMKLVDPWN
jgi:hypothetical protein